jgi:hypothetical protein
VRPDRFELPAFWFVAITRTKVNDLQDLLDFANCCYKLRNMNSLLGFVSFLMVARRVRW